MSIPAHGFPKSQRLKSRKRLQQLFAEGKTVRTKDLRLVFIAEKNQQVEIKCGVGLTTRYFKHAVDRNRVKRLLREAYRLQQQELKGYVDERLLHVSLFILFTGKELPTYKIVYENVGVALQKLRKALHEAVAENT